MLWLIPGLAFAVVAIALFTALLRIQTVTPLIGICLVALGAAAMVLSAFLVPDPHRRNLALACSMSATAAAALVCTVVIYLVAALSR